MSEIEWLCTHPLAKPETAAEQERLKAQQHFTSGLWDGSVCLKTWLRALLPGSHCEIVPVLDTELCSSEECLSRFLQTRLRDSQKVSWSGHSTTLTEMHRLESGAGWLLASLHRMILIWPAKDHGKISRVLIHILKTRSDCLLFQGGGEDFFFQIVPFFFSW